VAQKFLRHYGAVRGVSVDNVKIEISGDQVLIRILDIKAEGRPSSTGKSMLIASTGGTVPVDHPQRPGLKIALNAMVPV
jgi:hypothetical protein